MRFVYLLVRIYPYWAVPLIWVSLDLAIFFRRRKSKSQFAFAGISAILSILLIFWLYFRGDLYAERWILEIRRVYHL